MTVHWTDRAKARLRRIAEHIGEQRPKAVEPTIARIVERSMRLEGLPHSGRAVPEYAQPDLREVLERPYRIIYRIGAERIDVIAVMHYRELLPEDLDSP